MNQEKDLCPISDSGNHRYFIYKVVEVFEPYYFNYSEDENAETLKTISKLPRLYEKVEYAISGCNCGSAIKQRVKQK